MTRVAAIDCGTNSIRLLICDVGGPGEHRQHEVLRTMQIVRLGQDVDRTGRLAPAAIERTLAACREYAAACREHGVEAIRFCATSATRDASNAAEFRASVREIVGVDVEVLSGAEEAALSYAGAVGELTGVTTPIALVDVGGGSTEVIAGDHVRPSSAISLDIGSVRMTERHLRHDPPAGEEVAAATRDIDAALEPVASELANACTIVGVAGTVTTIAAGVLGLPAYDRERIHLAQLDPDPLDAICRRMLFASIAERREWPYMHPDRADVIGGGALIVSRIMRHARPGTPLLVSEHDILDGIAGAIR